MCLFDSSFVLNSYLFTVTLTHLDHADLPRFVRGFSDLDFSMLLSLSNREQAATVTALLAETNESLVLVERQLRECSYECM